jgi:hypothetical protein
MIKPFNEWGFRNVRQILPTADIERSPTSIPLQLSLVIWKTFVSKASTALRQR